MLARLKAKLFRFFLPSRSESAPEDRRRGSEKRKRDDGMEDGSEDDEDVVGSASNCRKHFRADDARPRSAGRSGSGDESWAHWALRKPMRNFFVSQAVRCLSPTSGADPMAFREPAAPGRPLEQTTSRPMVRAQNDWPSGRSPRESLPAAADAKERASTLRSQFSPTRSTPLVKIEKLLPNDQGWQSASSSKLGTTAQPVRNGGRYLTSTPYTCVRPKEKYEYQRLLLQPPAATPLQSKPQLRDASVNTTDASAEGPALSEWQSSARSSVAAELGRKVEKSWRTAPAASSSLFSNPLPTNKPLPVPSKPQAPARTPLPGRPSASPRATSVVASVTSDRPASRSTSASATSSVEVPEIPSSHFFSTTWLQELKDKLTNLDQSAVARISVREQTYENLRKKELPVPAEEKPAIAEIPVEVAIKEEVLPKLTPKMEADIDRALRATPSDEVLANGFRLTVTRKDMETLAGLNWLNDEVINFYMNLLMERGRTQPGLPSVYAFNTFFYPKLLSGGHSALKRWTRRVDIFAHDLLLVPVHLGVHWCLAVIDFRDRTIRYYDSMGGRNDECLKALGKYLREESKDKKKKELDLTDWTYETVKDIPQQMNGSDCGMFALKYAEYITRDAKITFDQMHMPYFRRRMVYEILTQKLL